MFTEALFEDATDGGHERTAPGEEDSIDLGAAYARGFEERIDALLDGTQLFGDPALKGVAGDGNADVHAAVPEMEFGLFGVGKLEFYLLHGLVQMISKIFLNQRDQGFDLFRLQRAEASGFQDFHY